MKGIEETDVSPGFVLCCPTNPIKTGRVFDAQVTDYLQYKRSQLQLKYESGCYVGSEIDHLCWIFVYSTLASYGRRGKLNFL